MKFENFSGLVDETPCSGCSWPQSSCLCPADDLTPAQEGDEKKIMTIEGLNGPMDCYQVAQRLYGNQDHDSVQKAVAEMKRSGWVFVDYDEEYGTELHVSPKAKAFMDRVKKLAERN